MRILGPILAAAVTALAAGAYGQADKPPVLAPTASEPPLFEAVITFCVDTGAKPDAVKAAIEAAGGRLRGSSATAWPFSMTTTSWDYTADGHSLTVSAGTIRIPQSSHRPEMNADDCIVTSYSNEDASVAAIRKWVGIPPGGVNGGITAYEYQEVGTARMAMDPNNNATRTARAEGREWGLTIIQGNSKVVSVQVEHILPAPQL